MLVVSRENTAGLTDLLSEMSGRLFQNSRRIALRLPASGVKCEGAGLFLADSEAAGQDVFHVHLHVTPAIIVVVLSSVCTIEKNPAASFWMEWREISATI
jgi:diadenosine tetraphosphate (Ap4A) HIT family hydrolase